MDTTNTTTGAVPAPHISLPTGLLVALGMVMSTDSLKTAPTVALNVGPGQFLWLWIAGGLITLVGTLSYVEMACAFPDAGGEYSFLARAWGPRVGALYAWSRFAVLHTGWIALMAHLLADYASAIVPMGPAERTLFALAIVAALALVNCIHVRLGFLTQALLVAAVALGFAAVTLAGFITAPVPGAAVAAAGPAVAPHLGVALIYVFLAYGGWSDMATLSAELRGGPRGMSVVTIGAILALIVIYVALNAAMAHGLGLAALAHSSAPGADVARAAFGNAGAVVVVMVVTISAVASINSTLIVCARITWAASRSIPALHRLGGWHAGRGTPVVAVLTVAGFSGFLTVVAGLTGNGFGAMVDYMTPVYWVFIALGMGAAIRLRRRHDSSAWPVRTPLFPLFPLAFIGVALVMLWSSLTELGNAALVGAGVMALGVVLERAAQRRPT